MKQFPFEWIENVIRIDSYTYESNEELVRFLVPLAEKAGLQVMEQGIVENGKNFINLIAFRGDIRDPNLLVLNTHLDTVSSGNPNQWTKTGGDPFSAARVGDKVYGLGSADVKIDFLCKLWALKHANTQNRPVALVGTYGEERGLVGTNELLKSQILRPKYALVGEPSNLELIYAHKGHIVGSLSFEWDSLRKKTVTEPTISKIWYGKAAHSSTPHLGKNALQAGLAEIRKRGWGITTLHSGTDTNRIPEECHATVTAVADNSTRTLFKFLDSLEKLNKDLSRKSDRRFNPIKTTISVNRAHEVGGRLELSFDIRVLPGVDTQKLIKKLRTLPPTGTRWVSLSADSALNGKKDSAFIKACSFSLKACKIKPKIGTKPSSTEAAVYEQYGAAAVVFGPGLSTGNVHKPNESNSLKQIEQATRFYHHFLSEGWVRL